MVEVTAAFPFGASLSRRIGEASRLVVELLPQRHVLSLRAFSRELDSLPKLLRGQPLVLPVAMNTAAGEAPRTARIAPDEWLIIDAPDAAGTLALIAAALAGTPHIAGDISASLATIVVQGPLAQRLLEAGCPLDLDKLEPGSATRTLIGKVGVFLDRRSRERFELTIDVSLCRYGAMWLHDAAAPLLA